MTPQTFKIQMGHSIFSANMDMQTGTLHVRPGPSRYLDQTRSPEKREYTPWRMAEAGDILCGHGYGTHRVITKNINWQDEKFMVEVETFSSHKNYRQKFPVRYCRFYLHRESVRELPCVVVGG